MTERDYQNDPTRATALAERPPRDKARLAAGAAGLAVVLGIGAYAITDKLTDHEDPAAVVAAPAQAASDPAPGTWATNTTPEKHTSPPRTSPSPGSGRSSKTPPSPSPTPSPSVDKALKKRIDTARSAAARDGHPVQRALTAKGGELPAEDVVTTTERNAEGSIRITTAKGDLTGRQSLLIAADDGRPVGNARCTQNLHFSNNATARKMPTMLLCWRTSKTRSVVTLAVAKNGKPVEADSVAVISREWERLR